MDSTIKTGILGYTELNDLIDQGVIEGVARESVNSNSINVTLGNTFLVEAEDFSSVNGQYYRPIEFSKRQSPNFITVEGSVLIPPGGFALASLVEKVNLPNDLVCMVMLRSSAARMGLEHAYAGFADSGYSGNLTLELKNFLRFNTIHLRGGDQVCQLVFHRGYPVPAGRCYATTGAKYCGDTGPQPVKQEHAK